MSKVYDYHLEMLEMEECMDWCRSRDEELLQAQEEGYGMENMEPNKAKEFARKLAEIA
jgi:hypothetical protein